MNDTYEVYRSLYAHLLRWCLRWVPADVAHRLARFACSEFVANGLILADTPSGPFAAAFASIELALRLELIKSGENRWREMSQDPDAPSEALLHEVNRLYVCLYHMAYDAALTWSEREALRLLAASFTPTPIEGDVRDFALSWQLSEAIPLKKMVWVLENKQYHQDLACAVAEQAWKDADERSFLWLREITAARR